MLKVDKVITNKKVDEGTETTFNFYRNSVHEPK